MVSRDVRPEEQDRHEQDDPRSKKDGTQPDEKIADLMVNVLRIVAVLHNAQRTVRRRMKQLHARDLVPEDQAEERVSEFVDGRTDHLEQNQPGRPPQHKDALLLHSQRDEVHPDSQQQDGQHQDAHLQQGVTQGVADVIQNGFDGLS